MEAFNLATVFSSIDHGGRYAYGQQPRIAHWNLARFGEAMLPLLATELEPAVETANGVLATFAGRYEAHWLAGIRAKLGLATADSGDAELVSELLAVLEAQAVDMTSAFRALSSSSSAAGAGDTAMHELLADAAPFDVWAQRWRTRLGSEARPAASVAAAIDRTNPIYVPRDQLVEDALARPPWTAIYTAPRTNTSSPPSRTRSKSGQATSATPCRPRPPPPTGPSAEPEHRTAPNCVRPRHLSCTR